jgi:integrase
MRGHVHKRGNRWAWVVDAGRDPGTGKRKQKTKGGFDTKAAAEMALREFLVDFNSGTYVAPAVTTLAEYLDEWLVTSATHVRPTTQAGYRKDVANICTKLGGVRLGSLAPQQIEKAYAELMATGGVSGRPLAPKTVKNVHTVLRRALGDAERLGLVSRNVVRQVRPPTAVRPEIVTWSADEVRQFLESVEDHRLRAVLVVLATTGMRRGEVMGLRWGDVDLEAGRMAVEQTLNTVNDKLSFGPVKTAKSRRRLSLDKQTIDALRRHRAEQDADRKRFGAGWGADGLDLVFRDQLGGPVHPDRFTRQFKTLVRQAGLPELRGPHNLRHTWATLALEAGVHPKVVSERLGHSTISITLDTYSHVVPSMDADAAAVVADSIFAGS